MTRDAQEVVQDLRKRLSARIGADRFDLWFGKQIRFEVAGDRLRVGAPDQFALDRVRKQFRTDISIVAREVLATETPLDFQVVPTSKPKSANQTAPSASPTVNQQSPQTIKLRSAESSTRPTRRKITCSRTLDTFVVGIGNRVAVTAARSVCERPGCVSPLFIYGPPGCGKSHLQESICATIRQSLGLRRVLSLSSEQFTSYFTKLEQLSGDELLRSAEKLVDPERRRKRFWALGDYDSGLIQRSLNCGNKTGIALEPPTGLFDE